MSTVFIEPTNLGDLVKYEEDCLLYSRDQVIVAPGQVLKLGTVLGRVTATQQVKAFDPAATDGSEAPCGLLLNVVDTTLPGKNSAVMLARESVVSDAYVMWPVGISAGDKAAAIQHLKSIGILIRQGA